MSELGFDPDRRIRSADSDPIYSPEASGTDPRGDWQTRTVVGVALLIVVAVFLFRTVF